MPKKSTYHCNFVFPQQGAKETSLRIRRIKEDLSTGFGSDKDQSTAILSPDVDEQLAIEVHSFTLE